MTLTQLNYFITIAETKSLNKAAEQLYVSQPSLTNAMKELEKELEAAVQKARTGGLTAKEIRESFEIIMEDEVC